MSHEVHVPFGRGSSRKRRGMIVRELFIGAQWLVPLFVVIWWIVVPGAGGWGLENTVLLLLSPVALLALCVPGLLMGFSARPEAVTRSAMVVQAALWLVLLFPSLAWRSFGGMTSNSSVLESWGWDSGAASGTAVIAIGVGVLLWIAAVTMAAVARDRVRQEPESAVPVEITDL